MAAAGPLDDEEGSLADAIPHPLGGSFAHVDVDIFDDDEYTLLYDYETHERAVVHVASIGHIIKGKTVVAQGVFFDAGQARKHFPFLEAVARVGRHYEADLVLYAPAVRNIPLTLRNAIDGAWVRVDASDLDADGYSALDMAIVGRAHYNRWGRGGQASVGRVIAEALRENPAGVRDLRLRVNKSLGEVLDRNERRKYKATGTTMDPSPSSSTSTADPNPDPAEAPHLSATALNNALRASSLLDNDDDDEDGEEPPSYYALFGPLANAPDDGTFDTLRNSDAPPPPYVP